jgi:hypothetical protein
VVVREPASIWPGLLNLVMYEGSNKPCLDNNWAVKMFLFCNLIKVQPVTTKWIYFSQLRIDILKEW